MWRSADDGGHWKDVTPAGLQPWSKIGVVEASRFDAGTAYLAVDRHRLDDQKPYIYRTRDSGAHWEAIVAGLPDTGGPGSVNVVREDTKQRGLLFVGTERGAYVSFDDGGHWQELQNGLPRTSVRDITLHGDDVVIATHGRGFYVLDDIASLRELARDASSKPAKAADRLFPLADAVRLHEPLFTGTPMPKDEPMADNPPLGAIVDYALANDSAAPVVIDILDSRGATLRHFSSADPTPPLDAGSLPVAPEWVPAPPHPATTAGAHRFVWDMRLEQPGILQGGDEPVPAVLAPPGVYGVLLRVAGREHRQTVRILPDPRVKLPMAAYQAEFKLAMAVQAARVSCAAALQAAAKQLAGLKDPAKIQAVNALVGAAGPAAPATPDGLTGIAERLDKLAAAADGADAAPTADALSGFAQAKKALDSDLARLVDLRK